MLSAGHGVADDGKLSVITRVPKGCPKLELKSWETAGCIWVLDGISIVSIVSVIWKLRRKIASAFHVAPDQEQLEINDFQLGQSGYRDAGF